MYGLNVPIAKSRIGITLPARLSPLNVRLRQVLIP
jgi:hypothetical protein